MWTLNYGPNGKLNGASNGNRSVCVNGHGWQDFLDWNANEPGPLDLSDKPPEAPPRDTAKEAILALLDKDDSGTITNAEKLEFCFRVCKRLARNI